MFFDPFTDFISRTWSEDSGFSFGGPVKPNFYPTAEARRDVSFCSISSMQDSVFTSLSDTHISTALSPLITSVPASLPKPKVDRHVQNDPQIDLHVQNDPQVVISTVRQHSEAYSNWKQRVWAEEEIKRAQIEDCQNWIDSTYQQTQRRRVTSLLPAITGIGYIWNIFFDAQHSIAQHPSMVRQVLGRVFYGRTGVMAPYEAPSVKTSNSIYNYEVCTVKTFKGRIDYSHLSSPKVSCIISGNGVLSFFKVDSRDKSVKHRVLSSAKIKIKQDKVEIKLVDGEKIVLGGLYRSNKTLRGSVLTNGVKFWAEVLSRCAEVDLSVANQQLFEREESFKVIVEDVVEAVKFENKVEKLNRELMQEAEQIALKKAALVYGVGVTTEQQIAKEYQILARPLRAQIRKYIGKPVESLDIEARPDRSAPKPSHLFAQTLPDSKTTFCAYLIESVDVTADQNAGLEARQYLIVVRQPALKSTPEDTLRLQALLEILNPPNPNNKSGKIQVFYRNLDSKSIPISVNPAETVENVKVKIQDIEGVPAELQRLIFGQHQLEEGRTLEEYQIGKASTIKLALSLRGGSSGIGSSGTGDVNCAVIGDLPSDQLPLTKLMCHTVFKVAEDEIASWSYTYSPVSREMILYINFSGQARCLRIPEHSCINSSILVETKTKSFAQFCGTCNSHSNDVQIHPDLLSELITYMANVQAKLEDPHASTEEHARKCIEFIAKKKQETGHFQVASEMSDRKPKFHLESSPTNELFEPPEPLRLGAHLKSLPGYHQAYDRSTREKNEFWLEIAKELHFEHFSGEGLDYNFDVRKGRIFTRFLNGSTTNMAYNCLERVIAQGKGNKIAYKFEGNEPEEHFEITYNELLKQVINCAAVLRSKGVKKGDAVALYLPMVLELPICMLACARIGATHAVIFAGFSADAVSQRLIQAKARFLVTADSFARGPKIIKLKDLADDSVAICRQHGHIVETVMVVEHSRRSKFPANQPIPEIKWNPNIDCKWTEEMEKCAGMDCPVEWVDAEHPSFVLYTSGSTGVPKGILHTTAGYMTYAYATTKYVFDAKDEDVYWCTADCGWITGHTYVVYGPLMNGVTSVIYEGIPTYPNASRNWQIVQKLKVSTLYTSPTAIRALMGFGNDYVTGFDCSSLKIIGTVGEPINPTAWMWLHEVVGQRRAAIVDTYWQTETGGHVITPLPGAVPTKPGSATLPFFGVRPVLLDNDGRVIEGPGEGNLCFVAPWPGISRSILGDHERFEKTYYKPFPGYYFTGDGARRDHDGYYWITGRVDDLMNVSGHLLSTAEIESALSTHPQVMEAAVVAAEHPIKGHSPYAFVVLRDAQKLTPKLVTELKQLVREIIGAFAVPDNIQLAPGLPKTRSGKVTRRILRKIAEGDVNAELGDVSTLVDSNVIGELWKTRNGQNG